MEWSLSRFWPRPKSKLYEEPKKLERLGLAVSRREATGRRARTVYAITASGRRALRDWFGEPASRRPASAWRLSRCCGSSWPTRAAGPTPCRHLPGPRNATSATSQRDGRSLSGDADFQARAASTLLVGAFLTDFYKLVADWADWPPSRSPPGRKIRPKQHPTRTSSARS